MNKNDFPNIKSPVLENVVSDAMLTHFFNGTSFGSIDGDVNAQRVYLAQAALKHQAGYHNGYTINEVLLLCDLIPKPAPANDEEDCIELTKRGRMFLHQTFASRDLHLNPSFLTRK